MGTQLATAEKTNPRRVSIIDKMAEQYDMDPSVFYDTLVKTAFKGCNSNEEFAALCIVAKEHNLNPFTKEIYAFPAKGGGIVPLVSIDGWLRIMNEHPQFDGISHEDMADDKGNLMAIECTIWRKDRSRPIKIIEYLTECKRNTDPWKDMPARMLRHKSTVQCARYAFGFSGIYDEHDVEALNRGGDVREIGTPPMRDVTPKKAPAKLTAKSAAEEAEAEGADPETGELPSAEESVNALYRDEPCDDEIDPLVDEDEAEEAEAEQAEETLLEKQRRNVKPKEGQREPEPEITLDMAKADVKKCGENVPNINSRVSTLCKQLSEDDADALKAFALEIIAKIKRK